MSIQKQIDPQFEISVRVQYLEQESRPEHQQFFFSYRVQIANKSNFGAQLMSRHWIITDGHGQVEEIRGAGVVGLQPKINAGQKFEYDSACPLTTTCGSMKGTYQFVSQSGETFEIEIPEFFLVAPQALH